MKSFSLFVSSVSPLLCACNNGAYNIYAGRGGEGNKTVFQFLSCHSYITFSYIRHFGELQEKPKSSTKLPIMADISGCDQFHSSKSRVNLSLEESQIS